MEQVDEHFSRKIKFLSFFMSVFVLYIHANNLKNVGLADEHGSLDYFLTRLLGGAVGEMAVPFFFMMSGYWFFRFDVFDKSASFIIFEKIKKRGRTLVVPYLIWNTVGMLFYMCVTRIPVISNMMNSSFTVPISIQSIYKGIVLHEYYFPFWYLQNLIALVVITPVLLYILKRKRSLELFLLLSAGAVLADLPLKIIRPVALFFFVLGAYLAIYARKSFEMKNRQSVIIIAAIFLGIRCITYFLGIQFLNSATLLLSPMCLCVMADAISDYKVTWFVEQSFFIYAAHIIPVTVVMKVLSKLSKGNMGAAIGYLITPLIALLILYVVARILSKFAPRLYTVICGGR